MKRRQEKKSIPPELSAWLLKEIRAIREQATNRSNEPLPEPQPPYPATGRPKEEDTMHKEQKHDAFIDELCEDCEDCGLCYQFDPTEMGLSDEELASYMAVDDDGNGSFFRQVARRSYPNTRKEVRRAGHV